MAARPYRHRQADPSCRCRAWPDGANMGHVVRAAGRGSDYRLTVSAGRQ